MSHEKTVMTLGRERVEVCLNCTLWNKLVLWDDPEHDTQA